MANNTLFEDQEQLPVLDDNKDYLPDLVGEGKKYKDNSALAKANVAKDIAILQREKENKALRDEMTRMREELQSRKSMEDFIQEMRNQAGSNPPPRDEPVDGPKGMTQEQIEELLDKRLSDRESQSMAQRNFSEVQQMLSKVYGPDYSNQLKAKAQELGLGESFLNDLASKSPKAFFSVLGITETSKPEPQSVFAPTSTVLATPRLSRDVKNFKYYQELKKKIPPEQYWSPKVQNEMLDMAAELGDSFYN